MRSIILKFGILYIFLNGYSLFAQEIFRANLFKSGIFIGGQYNSLNIETLNYEPDKEYRSGLEIGLSGEYFIKNRYSIGLNLSLSNYNRQVSTYAFNNDFEYTTTLISNNRLNFGLENKYYFKVSDRVFIPAAIPIGFSSGTFNAETEKRRGKNIISESRAELDNISYFASLKLGISYILNSKFEFNINFPLIFFSSSYSKNMSSPNNQYFLDRSGFYFIGQTAPHFNPINLSFSYLFN